MHKTHVQALGWGRSPGGVNGNPLQYSCLENPMVRESWWATVHGVAKSWIWLSTHSPTHLPNLEPGFRSLFWNLQRAMGLVIKNVWQGGTGLLSQGVSYPLWFLSLHSCWVSPQWRPVLSVLSTHMIESGYLITSSIHWPHWQMNKVELKSHLQWMASFWKQIGISPIHSGLKAELCCTDLYLYS